MPKPSQKLKFSLILIAIAFVGFVAYVSLLGENHRINALMENYFTALRAHDYATAAGCFAGEKPAEETHFLLEQALLERYGLGGVSYTVKIKRDRFWWPYSGADTVKVSLRLAQKGRKVDLLKPVHTPYVKDLFTVQRAGDDWAIQKVNPGELAGAMQTAGAVLAEHKLLSATPGGFRLAAHLLEPAKLSPLEKRVLVYQLNEAARQLR